MRVAGVDGWRRRWVAVVLEDGRFAEARLLERLAEVEGLGARWVALDVPLGLPGGPEPRPADLAARRFVGARRASVFLTPPRPVLEQGDYAAARRTAARLGVTVTAQAFALAANILEADALVRDTGGERVIEAHPEVSFAAIKGSSLRFPKRTWNGQRERLRLLASAGVRLPEDDLGPAGMAGPDDVLDAAAVAWTAQRRARGRARTLPAAPPVEPTTGRPMAIWY